MFPRSISLVTLGVRNLDRSRAFYARLGWEPVQSPPGVLFYQLAGQVFALFEIDALAGEQERDVRDLGTGAMTLARNFATEAQVDAAYDLALRAGGSALKRPEAAAWGGYAGYFGDPDGHVWELTMNPLWPLDEDGTLTLPPPAPSA